MERPFEIEVSPLFRLVLTASALRRRLHNAGWCSTPSEKAPTAGTYYDAHPIEQIRSRLAMLAYDMNDEPLSFGHGAPLRLRNEIELGFKQVKWVKGVEFVADFSDIGSGFGGYNQDHEFFGYRQSI